VPAVSGFSRTYTITRRCTAARQVSDSTSAAAALPNCSANFTSSITRATLMARASAVGPDISTVIPYRTRSAGPPPSVPVRNDFRHVARQQPSIGRANHDPLAALLDPRPRRERAGETGPQVVVLTHGVIQPADVARMPHGVAGIPQADDLVDRTADRTVDTRIP